MKKDQALRRRSLLGAGLLAIGWPALAAGTPAVNLRIELQPLHRLPRSNAVLFPVRTYLVSLKELAEFAPQWAKRMHRVIRDLDQELVDYKGFTRYRDAMVTWLSQYDDGTPVDESLQQ